MVGHVAIKDRIANDSFGRTLLTLWTGREPKACHERLANALLVAWCDCDLHPPSTQATRYAASCGVPLSSALSAGLLCQGDRHAPIVECARLLASHFTPKHIVRENKIVPGFGHPIFETDPRREAIEQLLHVDMGHVRKLLEIEKLLPVKANMAGFTAAIALDLDVPVEATGGFFLVGRSIGLIAHAVDQQNNPRMKLWQQQQ